MLVKGIGALLILLSSFGIGTYFALCLSERRFELEELHKKLLVLRGEIRYANTPLPDAIESIRLRSREKEGFFVELDKELKKEDGASFLEKWKKAVEEGYAKKALARKDKDELIRLGEYLGLQDKEMQIGQIDLTIKQMERTIREVRESEKEKKHLYRVLGTVFGIFLCIMMM